MSGLGVRTRIYEKGGEISPPFSYMYPEYRKNPVLRFVGYCYFQTVGRAGEFSHCGTIRVPDKTAMTSMWVGIVMPGLHLSPSGLLLYGDVYRFFYVSRM